jgi:hypothetical protein
LPENRHFTVTGLSAQVTLVRTALTQGTARLYQAMVTLGNDHYSINITSERGDYYEITFSIGVSTYELEEQHKDFPMAPGSLNIAFALSISWFALVTFSVILGLVFRFCPAACCTNFVEKWYKWYYGNANPPSIDCTGCTDCTDSTCCTDCCEPVIWCLFVLTNPGLHFAQKAHCSLIALFVFVTIYCLFFCPFWITVVDSPKRKATLTIWLFGYDLQGDFFCDHMVRAFRTLEYFFLFSSVIFASISSYETFSCALCANLILLGLLAFVLCYVEWQYMYVEFFEETSFWNGAGHLLDMFVIPLVVFVLAVVISIIRPIRASNCCSKNNQETNNPPREVLRSFPMD